MKIPVNKVPPKAEGLKVAKGRGFKTEEDSDVGPTAWDSVSNKTIVILYLLWYFNNTVRCELHAPASRVATEMHKILQNHGLVVFHLDDEDEPDVEVWSITDKGCALVRHIMDLPLPEQVTTWSMPEKES